MDEGKGNPLPNRGKWERKGERPSLPPQLQTVTDKEDLRHDIHVDRSKASPQFSSNSTSPKQTPKLKNTTSYQSKPAAPTFEVEHLENELEKYLGGGNFKNDYSAQFEEAGLDLNGKARATKSRGSDDPRAFYGIDIETTGSSSSKNLLFEVQDRIAYTNQTLKTQGLPQAGTFSTLDASSPYLRDLLLTFEAISELLRLNTQHSKVRSRLQDRVAKAESDLKISLTKVERLEDSIKDRDRKLGEMENNLHRVKGEAKAGGAKKKEEEVENYKSKAAKGIAGNLLDHEIKKKDIEIAKLKDALKKSSLLHKDKIDQSTKFSRFELNNFYDGLEKDFNLLDSKKAEIYKGLIEESTVLRTITMNVYEQVLGLVGRLRGKDATGDGLVPCRLTWTIINRPLVYSKEDVVLCFHQLLTELNKTLGLFPG